MLGLGHANAECQRSKVLVNGSRSTVMVNGQLADVVT